MKGNSVVFATEEAIQKKVTKFGEYISEVYKGESVTVVGVLRGGATFTVDLVKALSIPVFVEWICMRSYTGTESTETVATLLKPEPEFIKDRHILLVDDIIDTGLTAHSAVDLLKSMGSASIALVTAANKPGRRRVEVPEFKASMWKVADDCFVVGYGMDFNGKFRDLKVMAEYIPDADPTEPPTKDDEKFIIAPPGKIAIPRYPLHIPGASPTDTRLPPVA
jgi:hypoxanthine phosphoribosyltransferase